MSTEALEEVKTNGESELVEEQKCSRSLVLWSEVLATPMNGDVCSPAREIGDKECLHGAGLQKALDHGKLITRGGRRCAWMLLELASCYEKFGVSLMKSCQANPTLEGDTFKSFSSLSQQTRELANLLREEIATPMQGYHKTLEESLPCVHQKYVMSRQKACEIRQRALLARTDYLRAVNEAEEACGLVEKAVGQPSPSEVADETPGEGKIKVLDSPKVEWEKTLEKYGKLKGPGALDHVTRLLKAVGVLKKRYKNLVEKENNAVRFAQKMEAVALEGLQKYEEQRLCVFFGGLVRTFQGIKTSLDNLVVSADVDFDDSSIEQVKVLQKKGDFFSTILKVGVVQGEQTGAADADTLGLDEAVGKLRDEVQKRIASRLARVKKVTALASFFADVSSAADMLGNGLQKLVKHEDAYVSSKGTPIEHLRTLLSKSEGPRTLQLWKDMLKALEGEGEAFLHFASELGTIKSSKLDPFLSTHKEDSADVAEQDDARWKQLCDAARAEMRAETKYKQSSVQTAKARERMGSVDKNSEVDGNKQAKSPQKPQNRAINGMNKAFGNFLSILPDGGEQAMQILSLDARRSVVEKQVAEADEKEKNVKNHYDTAIAFKKRIMVSYRSSAQTLVKRYELEEISGVEDIKVAMESLVAILQTLRISRCESLRPLLAIGDQALASALVDLHEWLEKTSNGNETSVVRSNDDTDTSGFMLHWPLSDSEKATLVSQAGRIWNSDSFESDCSELADKDDPTGGPTIRVSVEHDSNRPLDLNSAKTEEESGKTKGDADGTSSHQTAQWLKKSFSAPIGKPVGFKSFRKLHSQGEVGKDEDQEAADDATEFSTISTTIPPQNGLEVCETELFSSFWPDYEGTPPGVTNTFACAFLPKDCNVKKVAAIEHGRLFLTYKAAVFVAFRGKKAVLYFSKMITVEKGNSLFGPAEDTILISAQGKGVQPTTTLLLSCFIHRDQALEIVQSRIEAAKKLRASVEKANGMEDARKTTGVKQVDTAAMVARDKTIEKMETVLSKKIRGIAISRFHDIVWLDKTSDDTFYGSWLSGGTCNDITVGEWETSDSGFTGVWCGEKYSHKRMVTFQLKRNSMIGPPIAGVTQTQYCRVDGNDRSVMMMTVAFAGIPYSDSFTVEVRWVATRSGGRDILVQVGVFVEFHKSTILKSQIRSGTLSETKPVHESLFAFVSKVLSKEATLEEVGECEEDDVVEDDVVAPEKAEFDVIAKIKATLPGAVIENMHIVGPVLGISFLLFLRWIFSSPPAVVSGNLSHNGGEIARLNEKIDNLQAEMRLIRQAVEQLTGMVKDQMISKA